MTPHDPQPGTTPTAGGGGTAYAVAGSGRGAAGGRQAGDGESQTDGRDPTGHDAASQPDGPTPQADKAASGDGHPGQGAAPEVPADLEPRRAPLLDGQGRVRLSFSRVDTYRLCPRKFRYRYLDRLPRVPAPALSFGASVHAALERFYDRKIPTPPTVEELRGYLYEEWDSSGFAEADRDTQLAYYRHAQEVLRRFHEREAPRYRLPAATEAWFELPLDGAVVVGSIDRIDAHDDGALEVVDYKTNRRAKSRARVRSSLQLALYALACEHLYGRLPTAVTLEFLVPGVSVRVPVEEVDLDGARAAVADTAEAVRSGGPWPPTPNRLCDWCDYRSVCPAWDGEGPEVLGPAVLEMRRLRRSVRRDVATLRQLEDGVERARRELEG